MYTSPGQDLLPDIVDFKCSGMSREKARQLFLDFDLADKYLKKIDPVRLSVDNEIIGLNYSIKEIQKKFDKRWGRFSTDQEMIRSPE